MAVPQNTLIGKTRQSVGNATFTTWKGINVLKSKPVSVANPRTQGQVNQRQMMANFVRLFRLIAALMTAGFKQLAVKQSGYNAAASVNLQNGSIANTLDGGIEDPSLLQVAKGSLYPTAITTISAEEGAGTPEIYFSNQSEVDQLGTDKAYALIMDAEGEVIGTVLGIDTRAVGQTAVNISRELVLAEVLSIYLFFVQTGSGKVSNSVYQSKVVTA